METNTKTKSGRGLFTPVFTSNVGLNEHAIKHLQHLNQIPVSAPRQGVSYFQAKKYLA